MSFHQLKLQKDALRSVHNEATQPLQTTSARPNPIEQNAIGGNSEDSGDWSELEYGEESWTTMSEIDSQYSKSTASRFASLELSRISDSEDSDSDDVHEARPVPMTSRSKKQQLLPPMGIISTPTGIMDAVFSNHFQHHNTIAAGRIIGGTRLISPKESDSFVPQPVSQSLEDGQERLKEAEAQVLEARRELATVSKHLEELQEQHEIKVRELQKQLAAMKLKEEEQDVGNVAVIDSEYEDQLEIAHKEKQDAESKLDDALNKLRALESENEKIAEESHELQTTLENTLKKVRFAEDQNSALEFQVDEYKTKWEDSLAKSKQMKSELVTTQSNLENAERQVEVIMESCEMAIANATKEVAKERSLREEHAKKEHLTAQQLSTQCQENIQLKKEQAGLEKTVESLQQERVILHDELEKITSRRNDVEADLSKANDKCERLSSELNNFRLSIEILESDHDQKQKILQETLDAQIEELRSSVTVLTEKDELNVKRLSEVEAEASRLKVDAKASHLKEQEHIQVEQRLLSELKKSHKTAQEQQEASDKKLLELRMSMDELIVQNKLNKKLISEKNAEMSKLTKDSEAAKVELQAKYSKEQRHFCKVEQQLRFKLKESCEKATAEKECLDSTMNDLRKSINELVAKDERNQKLLLEHKAEMLKLKADSDAAKLEAQEKHDQQQQKSIEIKKLISELKETRKKAEEQKKSSNSEIENLRKSIDDLIAKDERELEMLRKSIDALAFKDELNQKMLSEHEEEEIRLKETFRTALMEAKAKFEEEQQKSAAVERQLLSDLKTSTIEAKALELEKDTLEKAIQTLKQEQCHLNKELANAHECRKAAEENVKQLAEEKRLLNADLKVSRYSVLRLESECCRVLAERDDMIESHRLKLAEQKSMASSSQETTATLQKELDISRNYQRDLEQDKVDLETRLHVAGGVHEKLVETHKASVQEFQTSIQKLRTENDHLQKKSLHFQSAKSDLELRLGKLQQEYEALQQTQEEINIVFSQKTKEQEEFSKLSSERCKELETECDDLRFKVTTLHLQELELEEKKCMLVNKLEETQLKLKEKEKNQFELQRLLSEERKAVSELEDEKENLMRKTTSMSVEHARSLVDFEKKVIAAETKTAEVEEECENLRADIALTAAAKETLSWKQQAVKEELAQLQEVQQKSEKKIAELLFMQEESKIAGLRQISQLMGVQKQLEGEKQNSNRFRVEMEEKLSAIKASWGDCKRVLVEKENELAKTVATVQDLQQQQILLNEQKEIITNEKNYMVSRHAKEVEDYEILAAALKKEIDVTKTDMLIIQREKEDFQQNSDEQYNKIAGLLRKAQHHLEVAEEEKCLLQSRLEDQNKSMKSVKSEKQKYQKSLESSRMKTNELLSKLQIAQSSIDSFTLQLETLKNERNSLENEVCGAGKREESLISDLRIFKEENVSLKQSKEALISEHRQTIDFLETTKTTITAENNGLQSELRSLKEEKATFMEQLHLAEKKSIGLQCQLDVCETQNSKLIDESDGAHALVEELEKRQKELLKEIEHLEYAKANSEILAESSIFQLKESNARLVREQEMLRKRVKNVEASKAESENIAQSEISELRRENHHFVTELEHLRNQVATLEAARTKSQNAAVAEANDRDLLITELKNANEEISTLESDVARIVKENSSLCSCLEETKENNMTLRAEVDGMKCQNASLETTVDDFQRSVDSLESEVDVLAKENSSLDANLKEAEEFIANLREEIEGTKRENAFLNANLKEATESIATVRTEARKVTEENSHFVATLKEEINQKKEVISSLHTDAHEAAKENSALKANLSEVKETLAILQRVAAEASKESSDTIAFLKQQLEVANRKINNLRAEREESAKEQSCLIASLNHDLGEAEGRIMSLEVQATEATTKSSCLIAELENNLKEAKGTINALETEAADATKENSCLIAELENNLKEAKATINALETEAADAAKENSCLIAELENNLKEAKGTITTLQTETAVVARESSCLIASLKDNLKVATGTIATLETKLDEAIELNSESDSVVKDLRSTVATMEKTIIAMEVERNCIRAERERAKVELTNIKKESSCLQSIGEDTIRSLQIDVANEQKKTESIMEGIKLVSQEKSELESRLRETEETLSKKFEAQNLRIDRIQEEHELETTLLERQLEEENTNSTLLREIVDRLESEIKAERSRASKHEYRRRVDEAKIEQLKEELKKQTKTTKKLGKLLKRTMNSVTRVSQMKMEVDLCYYDTAANEYRQMPKKADYSGGLVDSKPHGAGVMKFDCGDMYLGTFDNGELCGEGSYIVAPYNVISKENGKLHFKGLYDYNEIMRQRVQH